jgi:hypothetical protein
LCSDETFLDQIGAAQALSGATTAHRSHPRYRGGFPRPSARVDLPVHHRDVGALLDQLAVSGTLRALGGERMIFRHDVFRDWAVANLIDEDISKIGALPLTRLAPASLARGVELAARLAIEESSDGKAWKKLLDGLSGTTVHGSWRRAVLMALVRSEHSAAILGRAEQYLLADSGHLLKDLVRMVMALEVAPASRVLAGTGLTLSEGIGELTIPAAATWHRLARWIVGLKDRLPASLIPDVAELFTNYASASWMFDSLARVLVAQLQAWLMEMERYQADRYAGRGPLFGGGLNYDAQGSLHEYLRSGFATLSAIKPDLAEEYVRFLLANRKDTDRSAEAIIKRPGNLAQAAPKALAELTAVILINDPKKARREFGGYERAEPFTYADHQFLSPSPARGPFLDLLVHSPKDGLALIRQLALHACTFDGRTRPETAEAVVVELESGPRRFPYPNS